MAATPQGPAGPGAATARTEDGEVSDPVLEQAVAWYVRQASSPIPGAPRGEGAMEALDDRRAFDAWLAADPEHQRAWGRLQGLVEPLKATRPLGAKLTRSTLSRADELARRELKARGRRRILQAALWIGPGGAVLLWQSRSAWREQWSMLRADHRTGTGERRDLILDDGSRLQLNTASAVDVRFDAGRRLILLHQGEIRLSSGSKADPRTLEVRTLEGRMLPVGTRFVVRRGLDTAEDDSPVTRVSVEEGAVDVLTLAAPEGGAIRVGVGRGLEFSRASVGAVDAAPVGAGAWAVGFLVAQRTPLRALLAELERHRPGIVTCAAEVADLPVTGTWPLDGDDPTGRILTSLERVLPLRVRRFSRYWVTVGAR